VQADGQMEINALEWETLRRAIPGFGCTIFLGLKASEAAHQEQLRHVFMDVVVRFRTEARQRKSFRYTIKSATSSWQKEFV
jgi:hypothetical protein